MGKSWHKGVVKGQGLRSLRTGWFPSVRAVTFGMLPNFRDPQFFFICTMSVSKIVFKS